MQCYLDQTSIICIYSALSAVARQPDPPMYQLAMDFVLVLPTRVMHGILISSIAKLLLN